MSTRKERRRERRERKRRARGELDARITTQHIDGDDGQRYALALIPEEQAREFQEQALRQQGSADWRAVAQRVWARVRGQWREPTTDTPERGTTDPIATAEYAGALAGTSMLADRYYEQMKMEQARSAKYADYHKIDIESSIARRALNVTVNNAYISKDGDQTSFTFESDDSQLQAIGDDLDQRLNTKVYTRKFCRSALKYGDGFTQPVADGAGAIVAQRFHLPKYVRRNEDAAGRLDAERAFEIINSETGAVLYSLLPWQMIHLRYNHDLENLYGSSFYLPSRKPYRRLEMLYSGLVIRRLSRSSKRYSYTVPMNRATPLHEQNRILDQMEKRLGRESLVDSSGNMEWRKRPPIEDNDIFLPWLEQDKKPEVTMLDPGGLQDNLDDVRMFRDDLIVGLGVPPAYLGLDKEVRGRAHLGWIDIEYARMIRAVQEFMATEYHRPLYNLQFWLIGLEPKDEVYRVVYPPVSFVDERVRYEVEQLKWTVASIAKRELGVPVDWILTNIVGLPEDEAGEVLVNLSEPEQQPSQGPNGWQMATPAEARRIRDMAMGQARLQDALLDLRDRLGTVARGGFLKPAEY